jgi:hypothetical protein
MVSGIPLESPVFQGFLVVPSANCASQTVCVCRHTNGRKSVMPKYRYDLFFGKWLIQLDFYFAIKPRLKPSWIMFVGN